MTGLRPDPERGEMPFLDHLEELRLRILKSAAALIKARSSDDRVIADALNVLTPYVLRHTCGKRMLDAGAQLTEVAAILGHEDLNTTRRYTQPGAQDLHRAVGWIANHE